jgi:hypothetical protein
MPAAPAVIVALGGKPTPTATPTPKQGALAYRVVGVEEELTKEIMREWFVQSIIPLVGKEAAGFLKASLAQEQPLSADKFLASAIAFRKSVF